MQIVVAFHSFKHFKLFCVDRFTPNTCSLFCLAVVKVSYLFAHFSEAVKYVNTPIAASESYSVPNSSKQIPKYLEIIYDENDDQPVTVHPYEIPLPPLDEVEIVHSSSPTSSMKSIGKSSEFETNNASESNENCIKGRTISSASTVSETSVFNPPKKKEQPNASYETDMPESNCILTVALPNPRADCTSNEKLLLPQQPPYAHDINKQKLQQMYANTNIETAIRTCDGITSM